MNTRSIPRSRRFRRLLAATVALLVVVVVAFAVQQSLTAASATATPGSAASEVLVPPAGDVTGSVLAPSDADGVIRDGDQPTVFDTDRVAIANLDPALREALQAAADDAAADGVEFRVNSGWRSDALQERMLQDAIAQYGSEAEAARWVATPQTSPHVTGDAVDLGPLPALDWLAQRGARYGLCQIYANESWHYELRPDAAADGCPQMYADPTEDPRMQAG
jgi:LAS superfamily LD-carboxypeptidase LdcB